MQYITESDLGPLAAIDVERDKRCGTEIGGTYIDWRGKM